MHRRTSLTTGLMLLAVAWILLEPPVLAQEPAGQILVIVTDVTGRSVAGVELVATAGDWHAATSDASGRARLQVSPGTWEITAQHAELAFIPTDRSVTLRAGESRSVEFRALARAARIQGRVRMRSEPPSIVKGLHAAAYPEDTAGGRLPVAVVPIGEDLAFAIPVPAGRWRVGLLEVVHESTRHPVVAEQGRDAEVNLEVDFRSLTGAAGFVYEAGLITERLGPAFSLTTVGLYAVSGDGQHRLLASTQARTDQTYGIFAAVPHETTLGVVAWRPGGSAVPAAARSRAGPGEASFADFRFVTNSGTLTGVVVGPGSSRVADAWVAAVSAVRYEEWMMWSRPVHAPDGAFRIRVPLGPVLVRAWRDPRRMGEAVRVSIGGTDPVTVRLEVP